MQIEVRDGNRTLWVEEFGCYLENGELAFSYHGMPAPPLPEWLDSPYSSVREARTSNNPEHPNEELRSARSSAVEVVAFYKGRVTQGGLSLIENPAVSHALEPTGLSRLEPGFYAENDTYRFCLDVYQHNGISFWRLKHGPKLPSNYRSKANPRYLVYVGEENGKVTLRNPDTGDELWASADAFADGPPRHADYPKHEKPAQVPISWNLVPEWLHLDVHPDIEVTASSSFMGDTLAGFSSARLEGSLRQALETLLDQLDASGFDGSGENNAENSYYLRPMTGGRHISVHISAVSGDKAIMTFVDTMGKPVAYGYYNTPRRLDEFLGRER